MYRERDRFLRAAKRRHVARQPVRTYADRVVIMINLRHPAVRKLLALGYKEVTAHAYLRDGSVKATVVARKEPGKPLLQGWTRSGNLTAALNDLIERAGLGEQAAGDEG